MRGKEQELGQSLQFVIPEAHLRATANGKREDELKCSEKVLSVNQTLDSTKY